MGEGLLSVLVSPEFFTFLSFAGYAVGSEYIHSVSPVTRP